MALVSADRPALDLAGLSLTSLPTEVFWHSGCLTHLDLQSNELYDLPESLSSCKSLQQITLDNNKLLYIPDVVFRLHALRVLQVCFLPCSMSAPYRFFSDLRSFPCLYWVEEGTTC